MGIECNCLVGEGATPSLVRHPVQQRQHVEWRIERVRVAMPFVGTYYLEPRHGSHDDTTDEIRFLLMKHRHGQTSAPFESSDKTSTVVVATALRPVSATAVFDAAGSQHGSRLHENFEGSDHSVTAPKQQLFVHVDRSPLSRVRRAQPEKYCKRETEDCSSRERTGRKIDRVRPE